MAEKMTSNELVDFLLCQSVQILEFVQIPLDIKPIRGDHVGFALDQVLGFFARDVRDGREHVRQMSRSAFDAVAMIKSAFSGFFIAIKLG